MRELGAKSLALFGSMARGEGSSSSDIDMLVELQSKTFDAYMDVKPFLEKILGRKVDLVLADAVKSRLRSAIREKPSVPRDSRVAMLAEKGKVD